MLSFHIIADNRRVAKIIQPSDRREWFTIAEIEHFLSQRLLMIAGKFSHKIAINRSRSLAINSDHERLYGKQP